MLRVTVRGDFNKLERFLLRMQQGKHYRLFNELAQKGTRALAAYTPKDSGITANSWSYRIYESSDGVKIAWHNSSGNKGYNIAILVQYGHATGTGGYVQANDFINPALRPIFQEIADRLWEEVTTS